MWGYKKSYQDSSSLDVAAVIDVEASEAVAAPDGIGYSAVVRFRRLLAVEIFGGDRGHVRVDWHVFRHRSSKEKALKPVNIDFLKLLNSV